MTDEMLVAQAEWLPQYSDSIAFAKARLAALVSAGTRVVTMEGFQGMTGCTEKILRGASVFACEFVNVFGFGRVRLGWRVVRRGGVGVTRFA